MTNILPNQEVRESNSSAVYAIYLVLRRQPWKAMAFTTWNAMKRFLLFTLLAAALSPLLPASAQAKTYEGFSIDVPFKFNIGQRTFKPGQYQFIFVGPGLMAMRDSHKNVVASIITRARETGTASPASKMVFKNRSKHRQLSEIWLENRSQVLDILGEEVAVRAPVYTFPAPMLPPDVMSQFDRRDALGFKY